MKLSIILSTLFLTSTTFAQSVVDLPFAPVYPPDIEKTVSDCSFDPERYREVSFEKDFALGDDQGNDFVEFKAGQSYHVSGMQIERMEYSSGDVDIKEYVLLAVPGHSVRPVTVRILDTISSLRVKAWKALECK